MEIGTQWFNGTTQRNLQWVFTTRRLWPSDRAQIHEKGNFRNHCLKPVENFSVFIKVVIVSQGPRASVMAIF